MAQEEAFSTPSVNLGRGMSLKRYLLQVRALYYFDSLANVLS
jgi:hypothetical protein